MLLSTIQSTSLFLFSGEKFGACGQDKSYSREEKRKRIVEE